jgi:hypothetical protein
MGFLRLAARLRNVMVASSFSLLIGLADSSEPKLGYVDAEHLGHLEGDVERRHSLAPLVTGPGPLRDTGSLGAGPDAVVGTLTSPKHGSEFADLARYSRRSHFLNQRGWPGFRTI